MGFVIAIILGLGLIAAIGYAIIYATVVIFLGVVGVSSLLAYAVFYAILGEGNAGTAMLLAIPLGIGAAALFFKNLGK